jgi:hypothetical protein
MKKKQSVIRNIKVYNHIVYLQNQEIIFLFG